MERDLEHFTDFENMEKSNTESLNNENSIKHWTTYCHKSELNRFGRIGRRNH
jgi:hypothetical protein